MNYEITVNGLENGSSIRGFASVVFGGSFKIGNIAIMENSKTGEMFVSMPHYPSRKEESGYRDICNPVTKDFREELYGNILSAYATMQNEGTKRLTIGEPEEGKLDFTVRVTPFEREDSNLRGFASVVFGGCFAVSSISILQGKKGLFVSMPSYQTKNKDENGKLQYRDICYPVTKECREEVYGAIMEAYQREIAKQQTEGKGSRGREQAKVPEDGFLPVPDEGLPFR